MALLNPVYAFVVPFLCIVTVPLAVFAGITTTLAFSVLICRVIVVYLDVAISLLPQSLLGFKSHRPRYLSYAPSDDVDDLTASASASASNLAVSSLAITNHTNHNNNSGSNNNNNNSPPPTPIPRRRRRRPSSASLLSVSSATPVSEVGLGLVPSVGPGRDYEGVGGWRTGDDEIWTTINSRLELPDRQYARNHHRSPSGGATTPGEGGYLMMKGRTRSPSESKSFSKASASPNSSRARTPSGPRIAFAGVGYPDGYFPLTMSPKAAKKLATHDV